MSTINKDYQERVRVLQNQNRFLNEEVRRLAKLRNQEHDKIKVQERSVTLNKQFTHFFSCTVPSRGQVHIRTSPGLFATMRPIHHQRITQRNMKTGKDLQILLPGMRGKE